MIQHFHIGIVLEKKTKKKETKWYNSFADYKNYGNYLNRKKKKISSNILKLKIFQIKQ